MITPLPSLAATAGASGVAPQPAVDRVRVYLHTPKRRPYLATVIAPLVHELRGEHVHVSRGWLGGPHFDLVVRQDGIAWPVLAERLAAGAGSHPESLSAEEYLRQAIELGRLEAVPPPYPPLRPHGHTELLGPQPSVLGPWRDVGLSHLLTPLLATAATASDGALLAQVAEILLVLADSHPHGLRFGAFSFRSHAEAFLQWTSAAPFRRRLDTDRAALQTLAGRVIDGHESVLGHGWRQAFGACMTDFVGTVTDADLAAAAGPGEMAGPSGRQPASPSQFHQAMAASGVIDEPPQWFPAYRLTINLLYHLLPALDISPIQRFYLCYAVAESIDSTVGETWQERLAAVQAHLVAAP